MQPLFNPSPPYTMMLDINSCFATIEQQANPRLRGKPTVVAAYTTDNGCILAASIEAKKLGIKTQMIVGVAKRIYPRLVVLPPDPPKYRFINKALVRLLEAYTPNVVVKSIDEMALDFRNTPKVRVQSEEFKVQSEEVEYLMKNIAKEIKQRIRDEIGEWIRVSIGIAPNQYLAKVAASYQKPDGLTVITGKNIEQLLGTMALEELCGIKHGNGDRLRRQGITTPLALYHASPTLLKQAFHSKNGYDWFGRIHGWDTVGSAWDSWGAASEETKTIGHSYALPVAYMPDDTRLHQILCQLTEKMARRMRKHAFRTRGVHVSCMYPDRTSWAHGEKQPTDLSAGGELYTVAKRILLTAPREPVRILAVTSFALQTDSYSQQSLLDDRGRQDKLMEAVDTIDARWGDFTLFPARMLHMEQKVLDRIAFGGGKELQRAAHATI